MTPNLPVGGNNDLQFEVVGPTALPEDQTMLSLQGDYSFLGSGRTGSAEASLAVPTIHVVRTTLAVRHEVGSGWLLRGALPMGWISVRTPEGRYTEIAGFGDLELGGGYELAALWGPGPYRPNLLIQAGVAFPTGEQNKDSAQLSASPNILSVGTGSYSPLFSATLNQRLSQRWSLSLFGEGRVPLHTNNNGIRMGGMYNASLAVRAFPSADWIVEVAATAQSVGLAEEEVRGTMVNSGGVWLRAAPRIAFRAHERVHLSLGARVPFFVDVNGTQAVETVAANLGLAFRFGGDDDAKKP